MDSILRLIYVYRFLILAFYLSCAFFVFTALYFSRPLYEADAIISFQSGQPYGVNADKFAAQSAPGRVALSQVPLIESRRVLDKAINTAGIEHFYALGLPDSEAVYID